MKNRFFIIIFCMASQMAFGMIEESDITTVTKLKKENWDLLSCYFCIGHKDLLSTVKSLVSYENKNEKSPSGTTILHMACTWDCVEVVDYLLNHLEACPYIFDQYGFTPVHSIGSEKIMNLFIQKFGENIINVEDSKNQTLLDLKKRIIQTKLPEEILQEKQQFINFLLENGAKKGSKIQ